MRAVCRGACLRMDIDRGGSKGGKGGPHGFSNGKGPYQRGYKRCSACGLWIRWDGIFCPCCRTRLRARRRPADARAQYNYRKNAVISAKR